MKRPGGLKITDRDIGSGRPCVPGDIAICDCVCKWNRGEVLFAPGAASPFTIRVGGRDCYIGIEYGLLGMRVGGRRTVIVPPNMTVHERKTFKDLTEDAILVYELNLIALPAKWDPDMETRLADRSNA